MHGLRMVRLLRVTGLFDVAFFFGRIETGWIFGSREGCVAGREKGSGAELAVWVRQQRVKCP
ncbi:hypothetical protein Pla52n_69280 [Stieleria varia]|uniref:Uncharacterized protein n=1 Tax=Stieleria varia TaxID=2528005 RepID=A0A5C5ZM74_9BACT|nr:hypothetical protein Pla52n_69280 [Stieleria varia]